MALRLYNTLTAQKEPFEPVHPGKVGIYCCGPTVYMNSHIGHMVGPVVFDTIKRYLTYCGYEVRLVINITDVEDKLIKRAAEENTTVAALAQAVTQDYLTNLAKLGVDTIDHMPKATEHIDEIIRMTQGLIERGYAYESGGDVYFDVTRDDDYGKLSHRDPEALQAGARIEPSERKRNPGDFALWKAARPGEPSWDSPWGPGRPGWHIECSVMSMRYLGQTLDIHGGGLDLVFPHHENEIAQSESYTGRPFARYWLHNGLLRRSGGGAKIGAAAGASDADVPAADEAEPSEVVTAPGVESRSRQQERKMSKSKGAIVTVTDLLGRHQPETVRFFLLATHYRRPIDFSEERIQAVDRGLQAYYRFFERYQRVTGQSFYELEYGRRRGQFRAEGEPAELFSQLKEHHDRFLEAMDDDFNTGGAVGVLFDLLRVLNGFVDRHGLEERERREPELVSALRCGARLLRELAAVLGLFRQPAERAGPAASELTGKLLDLLVELRQQARSRKDYALADEIRSRLRDLGVTLEDRRDGTVWRIEQPP